MPITSLDSLSPKRRRLAEQLVEGDRGTVPVVARDLGMSDHAARTMIEKLYSDMGASDREGFRQAYLRAKWVSDRDAIARYIEQHGDSDVPEDHDTEFGSQLWMTVALLRRVHAGAVPDGAYGDPYEGQADWEEQLDALDGWTW